MPQLRSVPIRTPADPGDASRLTGLDRPHSLGEDARSGLLRRLASAEQPLIAVFARRAGPDWTGPEAA